MIVGTNLCRSRLRRALAGPTALVFAAAVLLAACDSGDDGSTTSSTAAPPPTLQPSTTRDQVVDLRVAGTRNVTLRGEMGSCRTPAGGLPKVFVVTNPALGAGGYIYVFAETIVPGRPPVPANVKVYIDGLGMLSPSNGAGVTVSSDRDSVTLDAELTGTTGKSHSMTELPTLLRKARITGTLRCT